MDERAACEPMVPSVMSDHMQCAAEPQRYTLRRHLREHGKATAAHVWANRCRWCVLGLRWRGVDLRHRGRPKKLPDS